jgi:hypothetical protein
MAKKINPDEIDESFIVSSIKKDKTSVPDNPERLLRPLPAKTDTEAQPEVKTEEVVQPPIVPEAPKEESRPKRADRKEYESLFIHESDLPPARFGKSVYIRKDYHDRISQILSVIASNEVSIFAYIDNVLRHHFEQYGDEIARSFKKNIIFK